MTRLICRLLLATLLLPLTAILAVVTVAVVVANGPPTVLEAAVVWAVANAFSVIYWLILWHGMVHWTSQRVLGTVGAGVVALLVWALAAVIMISAVQAPIGIAAIFGGALGPPVWILMTILIWRETPQERTARFKEAGVNTLACLTCGYNLTGLSEARCPECGATFTIAQLVAGQGAENALPSDAD